MSISEIRESLKIYTMVATPFVGPLYGVISKFGYSKTISTIGSISPLGYGVGYINTTFNNHHYNENKNANFSGALGAVAGPAGVFISAPAVKFIGPTLDKYTGPIVNKWLGNSWDPAIPALLQQPRIYPSHYIEAPLNNSIANIPSFIDTPENKNEINRK